MNVAFFNLLLKNNHIKKIIAKFGKITNKISKHQVFKQFIQLQKVLI